MKTKSKLAGFLIVAFAITFVSCNKKNQNKNGNMTANTTSGQMTQGSNTMNSSMSGNAQNVNANNSDFMANLSGDNQVPPVQTNASGMAYFKVSSDSSKIMYTIKLSNADSVIMAHIHYGVAGENGPPVVWLYPSPSMHSKSVTNGTVNGVLKSGTFTSSNLVGPMKGATIKDLIMAIKHDSTYVNIHNKAHPGGLIRGEVQSSGMMNNDGNM